MADIKEFKLPDLGEGLEEGDIIEWHVAVGDVIELNQTVADIETTPHPVRAVTRVWDARDTIPYWLDNEPMSPRRPTRVQGHQRSGS